MTVPVVASAQAVSPVRSLSERAQRKAKMSGALGVVEFAESRQGLGQKLLPAQKFFLKVFEKEALDDSDAYIPLRDKFNERVLGWYTEMGFYRLLRSENRFTMDWREYLETDVVQVNLCMGRRASKTTVIGVWLSYKLYQVVSIYHPQKWFGILNHDAMNITMTGLGEVNAKKLFTKFVTMIQGAPFFRPHILEDPTSTEIRLWTQYDLDNRAGDPKRPAAQSNSITVTAAANTPGVRGENNMFIVCDEYAHFNNNESTKREKPLDQILYESLTPSVSGFKRPDGRPFGRSLFLSSPNGQSGKFWVDFDQALTMGARSGTLGIQCSTAEVNPTVLPAFLRSAYNKSPAVFDQEYGAKFIVGGLNWIHNLSKFYASVDSRLNPLAPVGRSDRTYFLAFDFALANKGDGCAASICHYEPNYVESPDSFISEALSYWQDDRVGNPEFLMTLDPNYDGRIGYDETGQIIPPHLLVDPSVMAHFRQYARLTNPDYLTGLARPRGRYVVDYAEVRYARKGPYADKEALQIEDVLDWAEDLYRRWPIKYGVFDQWAGEIISQMVAKRGLSKRLEMVTFNQRINDSVYKLFSTLVMQDELKIPDDKAFLQQLLSLKVSTHSGYDKVAAPSGGHDDLFDACSRSLFLCYAANTKNPVLVGSEMQNLFNSLSPIRNSGAIPAGLNDPRLVAELRRQARPQAAYGMRNLAARGNALKVMNSGMRLGPGARRR